MTLILEGLGFMILLLGGAAAESENMLIPAVMIACGMVLMIVGHRAERRWN